MRLSNSASLTALAMALVAAPLASALAQDAAPSTAQEPPAQDQAGPDPTDALDEDTIVVLGSRLFGQVQTSEPPILELDADDIAAYGAGSIAELLDALGPQVNSASGRGGGGPVILVNGERIASFRELRSYPPEAIEKFEVFPEEVALQYGYSANQRVVNVILKQQYASREIEAEYGQPWDGGYSTEQVEATYLRIAGQSRLNVNLEWNNSSVLTEAERGIIQTGGVPEVATDPDPAEYRSLVSDSAGIEGTVNWSTRLAPGTNLSLNATYERDDSLNLQGLDTILLVGPGPDSDSVLRSFNATDPLSVDRRTETYAGASTLSFGIGDWQMTATADASHGKTRSVIQQRLTAQNSQAYADLLDAAADGSLALDADLPEIGPAGFDEALTKTDTASAVLTARGSPLLLPAGDVNVTLDAGYDWNRIDSQDTRNPGLETILKRGNVTAGANLGIPLTSSVDEFLGAVGDISLNANAGIDHLSDFGTLYDWSLGLNWGMGDNLSLSATYTNRDAAPSLGQLGNPEIATLNVPVFDLTNNETVLVTVITGGNPLLPAQNQSDWKFGVNWELPFVEGASVRVDYIKNHSTDVASSFPLLTPEIEAAFPDRVTRDSTGTLTQIDQRPVTFARQDQKRLQFNFNISGQIPGSEDTSGGNGGGGLAAALGGGGGGGGGPAFQAGGRADVAAPAGGQGGFSGAGGGFGGGGFAQMRTTLCAEDVDVEALRARLNAAIAANAAGEAPPEGMTLPPQMLERIAGDDGVIDASEMEALRMRMCSADGPPAGGFLFGGPPGGNGQGESGPEAERVAEARKTFCEADPEVMRAQFNQALEAAVKGEPFVGSDGSINLPPPVLLTLGGDDNYIDETEFAQLRLRICDPQAVAAQQQQGQAQGGGNRGGQGNGGNRGGFDGPPPGGGGFAGPPGGFAGPPGGGGGGGFRGGGGGFRGGGGGNGGRWFVNLTYNLELQNEVLIAPGVPLLDLLDGDALSGGGQARHSGSLRVGTFYNGFGMIWNGRYTGKSRVDGTGQTGSTDLYFGDLFSLDVRAFADLGQRASLVEKMPLLKDMRIGINIDNIFDARQTVKDSAGIVPLRYQPFLIDPIGRRIEFEIRKLF